MRFLSMPCVSFAARPSPTPDHFDDVPAAATEITLELLDDLAVAAHGTIEPLQIAAMTKIRLSSFSRLRARWRRLRLVHLAVAAEHPHLALGRIGEASVMGYFRNCLIDAH
jgi:hypothetical protein